MKYMKNKYGDENGNVVSFWATDDNVLCEDGKVLRENLDDINIRLEDIKFQASSRVYKPTFCVSSYWSEVSNNSGLYTMVDESKVSKDIEIWKAHDVDGVVIVIHIGLNTSTNKLFIGADLSKYINYMNTLITNDIPIYAVKVHKQKMTQTQIDSVGDFNEQYKVLLKEIADTFKSYTNRLFCFNEFKYIYAEEKNLSFVKSVISEIKNIGYKVGISTQGAEEMFVLSDEIKNNLDILGINHYRYISTKGNKTIYNDSLKSWKNSNVLKVLQLMKENYPDKEVILSESGTQDYWEALAKPEYFSWNNPTSANGKAQAIYLYGLLETTNEDFIDGVCWWYNFAYKDKDTSKLIKSYLGGEENV